MNTRRPTILCVDDDPDDQMMVLDTILELDPSIRVASALNGVEAMSFLYGSKERKELPCLVVMDSNMPLMDGKQALAMMKRDEVLKKVPVILFTTSASQPDRTFAAHHHIEFITKPVNQRELHQAAERLLKQCKGD